MTFWGNNMINEIYKEKIRLLSPTEYQEETGMGARFIIICKDNASYILDLGKDIVSIINKYSFPDRSWPSVDQWIDILPKKFTDRFSLEVQNSNPQDKEDSWSLEVWLYWMNPQHRTWFWWDSALFDVPIKYTHFVVSVKTISELPYFSANSFKWLFKACGAIEVISEDEL